MPPAEVEKGGDSPASSRAPLTVAELEEVQDFLVERGTEPEAEPLLSAHGAVAVLPNEVVSLTVDPVAEAWSYPVENISDVGVTADGDSVVVQYDDSIGPVNYGWLVVLDSAIGSIRDSYRKLGSEMESIGDLTNDFRVQVGDDDVLAAYPLASTDAVWERDLKDSCVLGAPEEVDVATLKRRAIASYACPEDGTAHAEVFYADSGDQIWGTYWDNASVPGIQIARTHDVPGGSIEPVSSSLSEAATEETLFMGNDYFPLELDPWKSVPRMKDYIGEPLSNMDEAPGRVIFSDDPSSMRSLAVVRSAHVLAVDEEIPFAESDVDESLKIEGELVENPAQWESGASGYVEALRSDIETVLS